MEAGEKRPASFRTYNRHCCKNYIFLIVYPQRAIRVIQQLYPYVVEVENRFQYRLKFVGKLSIAEELRVKYNIQLIIKTTT